MKKQISLNYFIDEKQPLGRGGFGTVYKGYYQQTQEPPFWVAVKELRRFSDGKNENLYYDQELAISKEIMKINSEFISNIVRVYEIFPSNDEADVQYVVMDLCAKDLSAFKKEKGGKLESQREIALGIKALHDCKLAHRDIKPDNIFLSLVQLPNGAEGYLYKVADIGKNDDFLHVNKVGTICYMAPDMLDFSKMEYTNKVDIWALGVMTHELLTGTILYNGSSSDHVRSNILKSPPYKTWYKESFNKLQKDYIDRSFQFIDHECIVDLIDQMLEKDPQIRKNIDEIITLIDNTIKKYEDFKQNFSMNRLQPLPIQQNGNQQKEINIQNKTFLNLQNNKSNDSNLDQIKQELISLRQTVKEQKEQLDNSQLIIQDKCDQIYEEKLKNKLKEKENIELKLLVQKVKKEYLNKLVEIKKICSQLAFNSDKMINLYDINKNLEIMGGFYKVDSQNIIQQIKQSNDECLEKINQF